MSKKSLPRCSCVTKDGTQCGRRVADGSQPPVCSAHARHTSPLTQRVERTPEEILRKLMSDRDPSIRLRAVTEWIDYQRKQTIGCPRCEQRNEAERLTTAFIAAWTDDEREAVAELLRQVRAVKETIYTREPQLRPAWDLPPSRVAALDSVTPQPSVAAAATFTEPQRPTASEAEPAKPYELPREHWDEVGLFKANNTVTHSLGDDHAHKILSGEIPFDDARAEQDAALRRAEQLSGINDNDQASHRSTRCADGHLGQPSRQGLGNRQLSCVHAAA
jgi:hypothetical protein